LEEVDMSSTTPNADNLLLGAGEVLFSRFDASGTFSNKWRHLGNVDKLDFSPSADKKDKITSMTGLRALLASTITSVNLEISMELNEFHPSNLALALLGDQADFTQADLSRVDAEINGGVLLEFDVWYPLLAADEDEEPALNPFVLQLKQGATVLVEGDDYEVNRAAGLVRILSTASTATEAITIWTGSIPPYDATTGLQKVSMLSNGQIRGRLMFVAAEDLLAGPKYNALFYKVQMVPDGALSFISDDYAAFTLKATVLADLTRTVGDQYGKITERPSDESGS
jgi:hypothetical protein